ncbi:hypothetical protein CJP72_05295 [Citrobacter sp. NCU1]|uniref:PerC family transcriptional regulator n=1 Tax=Citrobacter sp. NCU1 TaxID=2026683 RepID=UPI001391B733|nr:PerC family transcriptional regulator [Citrobacter sp. NCU1]NDO80212.1 hypothetical protein [Citrobacter sp. NCU1]
MAYPNGEKFQIFDEHAESLEKRGLWRRAAVRWLAVLDGALDEHTREGAMFRRNHCQRMAAKPVMAQEVAD